MAKLPLTLKGQDFNTHDKIYSKKEDQTAKDIMLVKAQSLKMNHFLSNMSNIHKYQ